MIAGMHRRRAWLLSLAAIAALAALGYLAMRNQPPAPAGPLEQLSIALPMLPHGALLHVAAAQGYFREEGLEVTILPATHGAAALDLLIQGKADLAVAAEVPVVKAVMQGEAIALVANTLYSQNDPAIVARRDRGIAALPDLAGKRFGVTFGTSGEYFLWAFLVQARVAPESVTLVDLSPAEIVPALANGAVDAVATWQPFVSKAQSALGDNGVLFAGTDAYTQTFVVVARSDYLQGRSRAMQMLVRALLRAEQFVQSRPEEALNVVAERLKSRIQELRALWSHFDFKVDLSQSQLIALESQARWAMTRGYSAKGPVPNLLPHLYLDALLAVKPDRVTVIHERGD